MQKSFSIPQGIGVDVVALSRMEDFWHKHRKSLDRILSPEEREKITRCENPPRLLAYFFSAKEAVFKSLDLDWLGIEGFRMIRIELPRQAAEGLGRARLFGKMKEKTQGRLHEWRVSFLEVNGFVVTQAVAF